MYSPPSFISCKPSTQPWINAPSTTGASMGWLLWFLVLSNTVPSVRRPSYSTVTKSPLATCAPVPSLVTLYCRPDSVVFTPSLALLSARYFSPAAAVSLACFLANSSIFFCTPAIAVWICCSFNCEGVPAIWSLMPLIRASVSTSTPLFFSVSSWALMANW